MSNFSKAYDAIAHRTFQLGALAGYFVRGFRVGSGLSGSPTKRRPEHSVIEVKIPTEDVLWGDGEIN